MSRRLDELTEEYAGWCARNNLPNVSAADHDPHLLTDDQHAWLADFIARRDAAFAALARMTA